MRRYLAESVLTPEMVGRACYRDLVEFAATAGLVEDKRAWPRAGEERANAERELEGGKVVEDIDAVCDVGELAGRLVDRVQGLDGGNGVGSMRGIGHQGCKTGLGRNGSSFE